MISKLSHKLEKHLLERYEKWYNARSIYHTGIPSLLTHLCYIHHSVVRTICKLVSQTDRIHSFDPVLSADTCYSDYLISFYCIWYQNSHRMSSSNGAPAFVRILKLSFVRILSSDFVRMGFYRVLTMSEWVFIEF